LLSAFNWYSDFDTSLSTLAQANRSVPDDWTLPGYPLRRHVEEIALTAARLNSVGNKCAQNLADGWQSAPACFRDPWVASLQLFSQLGSRYGRGAADGQPVPRLAEIAARETLLGANPAMFCYGSFTSPAATLIARYGSEPQKETFLARLQGLRWDACLCVTEKEAGSDLSRIQTSASPIADSVYALRGEKRFISGAAHDYTENTVFIVLGRSEDSEGAFALSLFLVPKYWRESDGSLVDNGIEILHLPDKMGLRGLTTPTLTFGSSACSRAWLLGKRPGFGLVQLRVLMQLARTSTALIANGVAANAISYSTNYARGRIQGRPLNRQFDASCPSLRIEQHPDIQLLRTRMHVRLSISRSLVGFIGLASVNDDRLPSVDLQRLMRAMIPMAKVYSSEEVQRILTDAMQICGAVGYLASAPIEQAMRDTKILPIWEGTNYLQATDFLRNGIRFGADATLHDFLMELCIRVRESGVVERKLVDALFRSVDCLAEISARVHQLASSTELERWAHRILHVWCGVYGAVALATLAVQQGRNATPHSCRTDDQMDNVVLYAYFIREELPVIVAIADVFLSATAELVAVKSTENA
jgi:alkylation response protein AidB-like acyl-CoA dehydrogenase